MNTMEIALKKAALQDQDLKKLLDTTEANHLIRRNEMNKRHNQIMVNKAKEKVLKDLQTSTEIKSKPMWIWSAWAHDADPWTYSTGIAFAETEEEVKEMLYIHFPNPSNMFIRKMDIIRPFMILDRHDC